MNTSRSLEIVNVQSSLKSSGGGSAALGLQHSGIAKSKRKKPNESGTRRALASLPERHIFVQAASNNYAYVALPEATPAVKHRAGCSRGFLDAALRHQFGEDVTQSPESPLPAVQNDVDVRLLEAVDDDAAPNCAVPYSKYALRAAVRPAADDDHCASVTRMARTQPSSCYLSTTQVGSGLAKDVRCMVCVFMMDLIDTFDTTTPTLLSRAVSLLDRFLSVCELASQDVVLLAVACFSIACKLDETQQPSPQDLMRAADHVVSSDDVVMAEAALAQQLGFELAIPTAKDLQVLVLSRTRITTTLEFKKLAPLSDYVLELALIDYDMLRFPPQMIAGASVLLSRILIAHLRPPGTGAAPRVCRHSCRAVVAWTRAMQDAVRLEAVDMHECACALLRSLHRARELASVHAAHVARHAPQDAQAQLERALAACGVAQEVCVGAGAEDIELGDVDTAVLRVVQRYCCAEHQFVACQPLLSSVPAEMSVKEQAFFVATQALGALPEEKGLPSAPWLD